ncbi:Alpha/Beta hydrolase protein [Vararia minispora EC-137]|uniref:Alpha/Beta hydrolase protein n=1 Tax=Vararia minispora EC-137 TaxID=1314806 RepID=A0ACB8QZ99_9AGAM|nr:Alpha/Beta hydrolase protein [Vararia minispora EC-137]
MTAETPFTIAISDSELELLQRKLELTGLPDELEDAGWDYGVPLADVRRLVDHWKGSYDWRKAEAELNAELPQFTRDIEVDEHGTLNVHYVHKKSDASGAIPLLFVHGCKCRALEEICNKLTLVTGPGSFIEVRKILPMLTAPPEDTQAFHVVAVGLPGYGFSEAPHKKGFGPIQMAEVGHKLMLALGYDQYVAQGGDWGSIITRIIAAKYGPTHVKAWHTNMIIPGPPHPIRDPLRFLRFMVTPLSNAERRGMARGLEFRKIGMGYLMEQATKPQTIGYSLADSPVGLLSWIYEKLVAWTDNYPWTDDEVLTWVSIYWFSRAGPTSAGRLYYENRVSTKELEKYNVRVHTGFSYFPQELFRAPKALTRNLGKVVQDTEHEKGGHFAAWEVPELLVGDLRKMFGKGGPAHGVVQAKM